MHSQDSLQHRWLLKTDIVAYLPSFTFNTGKANIELEFPRKSASSMLFKAGYIYSYGASQKDWYGFGVDQDHTSGFLLAVEYRKYVRRSRVYEPLCLLIWPLVFQLHSIKNNNTGLYFSAQGSYQQTRSLVPVTNGIFISYPVNRINPSFLVRIGFQSVNVRKLAIDQSLGVGLQYVWCDSYAEIDSRFYTAYPRAIKDIFPFLNYSFKIGFAN